MNIRTLLVITLMLVVTTAGAQTMSTIQRNFPLNVGSGGDWPIFTKLVNCATPTITLVNTGPTKMPGVPAGTIAFIAVSTGGTAFGTASVTSTADGTWPELGTGSYKVFPVYPGTTAPNIYFCPSATGTTPTVRFISIQQGQ